MRITKKILIKKLEVLAHLMGKTVGYSEGHWNLDHNSIYGGYKIVEYLDKGGERHPLLNKRLGPQQMSDALDMAIQALNLKGST